MLRPQQCVVCGRAAAGMVRRQLSRARLAALSARDFGRSLTSCCDRFSFGSDRSVGSSTSSSSATAEHRPMLFARCHFLPGHDSTRPPAPSAVHGPPAGRRGDPELAHVCSGVRLRARDRLARCAAATMLLRCRRCSTVVIALSGGVTGGVRCRRRSSSTSTTSTEDRSTRAWPRRSDSPSMTSSTRSTCVLRTSSSSERIWRGGLLQLAWALGTRIRGARAAPPRPRCRRWVLVLVLAGTGISLLRSVTGREGKVSRSAPAAGFRAVCSSSSTLPTPSTDEDIVVFARHKPGACAVHVTTGSCTDPGVSTVRSPCHHCR